MSNQLPAEVGDNEFWLLAKQCAALGYDAVAGDSPMSLQARLVGLQQGSGGGGGSASDPTKVLKTGDTMSGPLAIATGTQPELNLSDAASGPQTLKLNNSQLKLADSSAGNQVTIALASVSVEGNGAGTGSSANRTTVGVNSLSLGHKSWGTGLQPLTLYQSNQGDLWIQFTGGQNYRVSDYANSRFIVPTDSLVMFSPDAQSSVTLSLVNGGEVVAAQTTGPNAGKSVNLTAGKWA